MRRVRAVLVTLSIVALQPLNTSPAHAQIAECLLDTDSGVLTITPTVDFGLQTIWRNGDAIYLRNDPCADATVSSVDTIEIDPSGVDDTIEVSFDGGPFTPGRSDEGDGSSEIEFVFMGAPAATASFRMTSGADHVTAGMTSAPTTTASTLDLPALNLNADEATEDVDVVFETAPTIMWFDLRGGDDVYSEAGIGAVALPLWTGRRVAVGGAGDDEFQPANTDAPDTFFQGSGGTDTLSFSWLPLGCTAIAYANEGSLLGDAGCSATFAFDHIERSVGHAGVDWLGGDGGDDVILTRGGDDQIFADAGDDVLNGGPGRDIAIWILTGRVRVDLRDGIARLGSSSRQVLRGIEDLYGSPKADELSGDGRSNVLYGDDGDDVLRGRGGVDQLNGGEGIDRCAVGRPGAGESTQGCEN